MDAQPMVRTGAGSVRGRIEDAVAVFRGIPFAAPPVGPLRFQAPRPAGRRGTGCARRTSSARRHPRPGWASPPPVAAGPARHDPTDWLTLNVWTPDPAGAGLPVMVWIYGGAYRLGSRPSPTTTARRWPGAEWWW